MATLTPEELAAIKIKIAEAELAYHNLMTGGQARVVVDQNGERVEFTAINAASLLAYIQMLKGQLPVEPGTVFPSRRPISFLF